MQCLDIRVKKQNKTHATVQIRKSRNTKNWLKSSLDSLLWSWFDRKLNESTWQIYRKAHGNSCCISRIKKKKRKEGNYLVYTIKRQGGRGDGYSYTKGPVYSCRYFRGGSQKEKCLDIYNLAPKKEGIVFGLKIGEYY